MAFSMGRVVGACVLCGACAGLTASYSHSRHAGPARSQVEMTVVPVGRSSVRSAHTRLERERRVLLSGVASWYGDVFDGRLTANGEVFDQEAMTACHRTLPFGTLVRVINVRNHRSVVVRINDRGVLTPERVIDLSSAAANKLGMLQKGLAPVRLEIVAAVQPAESARRPS